MGFDIEHSRISKVLPTGNNRDGSKKDGIRQTYNADKKYQRASVSHRVSSGGLEACVIFSKAMPADNGIAFVLVVPLDRGMSATAPAFAGPHPDAGRAVLLDLGLPELLGDHAAKAMRLVDPSGAIVLVLAWRLEPISFEARFSSIADVKALNLDAV